MYISCRHCHTSNKENQLFCHHCQEPLWSHTVMVNKLLKKQDELEKKYLLEIQHLKDEIYKLKNASQEEANEVIAHAFKAEVHEEKELSSSVATVTSITEVATVREPESAPSEPAEPSWVSLKIQEWLEPLHEGIALLIGVYDKYKREGKLPIFFMTIAGILAILFGVGYLMQYSFQYLGIYEEITKIGLGFVAAVGLIGLGIRLTKKGEVFEEYASALICDGSIDALHF